MENLNKRAVSEVIQILNHTEKDITERIPEKFIKFLFENADNDYKSNIDFSDENWENLVDEDTKALLALIYRDYIVSETERLKLLEEERQEKEKQEELLREKYNPDNLFKKNQKNEEEKDFVSNTQLVEIKKAPWYKTILKKILSIF